MISKLVIAGIMLLAFVGIGLQLLSRSSLGKVFGAFTQKFYLSNPLLLVFSMILLIPVIWWMYSNRDVADRAGAFTAVIGLLVVTLPFAIFFGMLLIRIFTTGFIGSIFANGGPPEPERYTTAKVLLAKQEFAAAADEFRRLLEEKPSDYYCREQLAEILDLKLKDRDAAIIEYRKLAEIRIDPNRTANVMNRIADILDDHRHDRQGAVEALQTIVDRFPGTPAAERARKRIGALTADAQSNGIGPSNPQNAN